MKMIEKELKQYNYENIFIGVLIIIMGIIMILFPKNILNIISYFIGGFLILNGVLKIYYYIKFDGKYNIFNYDLSYGILNIIMGLLCLFFKNEFQSIIRIIIGLIAIYEGIKNLSLVSKLLFVSKKLGIISLLLSILMMLLGVIIILTKGILVATVGYMLTGFAIIDIVEAIIFNRNIRKIEKYFENRK